jgi:hypothetical protein
MCIGLGKLKRRPRPNERAVEPNKEKVAKYHMKKNQRRHFEFPMYNKSYERKFRWQWYYNNTQTNKKHISHDITHQTKHNTQSYTNNKDT